MTEPLFDVPPQPDDREHFACDRCTAGAWCSLDTLRVRGWAAYDGTSFTGKTLKIRICPACRGK